jgi:uncharacterized protein YdaU (DUF1376 family)
MLSLTLEERGAYNTILDLIYDRGGPVPDDARWLAGWMGVSLRRWGVIRSALILAGKLYEVSVNSVPSLMNQRAACELENQAKLSRKLSESGAKGGRNSRENEGETKENKDLPEAHPSASLKLKTETETLEPIASPSGETIGADALETDPDKQAWNDGPIVLMAQGGMNLDAAKRFFGKLLATHRLQPRDLLGAIGEARANSTRDPQGWLTKAAAARGKRRQHGQPEKRVGFV